MFTGIIQGLGIIRHLTDSKETKIIIDTDLNLGDCKIGSSICCDGICLTAVSIVKNNHNYKFEVNVGEETAVRSNVKFWYVGNRINIEKSLKVGDEISGHIVYGHVDCIARLDKIEELNSSWNLYFSFNQNLFNHYSKFLVEKGSISVNGISLTIAYSNNNLFNVSIIPHTYKSTNLSRLQEGDFVNIEFDSLARYLIKNND